ncbi:MAG: threonine synthase [Woeseia sp.]
MPSFVSHLEAAIDGTQLSAREQHTLHEGRPIWVRYDLDAVSGALQKEMLQKRPPTLWRYRELLPVEDDRDIVSLGESISPLLRCERLGASLGLSNLFIKDESRMPTGSFKDRGQTVAITMAKWFGVRRVAIPTAGNAGGSMAAYAARAGMEAFVFMPEDSPEINQYEAVQAGARTYLVNGLINDCAKIVSDGKEAMGWFDLSTLKEPYRVEGKKTMGLELAEQLDWMLPDVILYPTGGGTGLIGMWKAFMELRELGWLEGGRLPRMVAVQSDGCCPIVRAFDNNERFADPFEGPATMAAGLRVPAAVGDFMMLDVLRESDGCGVAVSETRIPEWMRLGTEAEGISIGPESAACIGAAESLVSSGWLTPRERVVIFSCGGAKKYPNLIRADLPRIDKDNVPDWAEL